LGAVAAEVSGNNALAGAAGAAGGELAARELMKHIHGENAKVSDLSEEEKQTISTLSTLAAGLAGGIAGDSTGSAVTGAQAGKNAIENNFLSVNELDSFAHQARACEGESCKQVIKEMVETNIRNQQEMMDFCNSNPTQCAQKYGYLVDQWPVFERTLKNMDRDGTLPVGFRNYLSAVNTLGQAATGKVGELGWTKRFEAMGMSQETAAAMAMTLPIVIEGAKGPKSSPTTKGSTGAVVNTEKAALERLGQNSKNSADLSSKQQFAMLDKQAAKSNVVIDPNKINYIFGRVSSNKHNADRSTQMEQSMRRLGIPTDEKGAQYLMDHISKVPKTQGNIVQVYTDKFGKYEVRESLLFGPSGKATKLETSFEIMPDGTRRFITTIPKEGKK
ncbi:VENN motif pre-toxin domain-containing protein, partial [Photorhabdus sp. RW14-46]|uniref:VENN motif pre-toxin domain-containing protein n=1 Tax=Photorhabdus sp. RW14-46 TaxID=2100168 RepID=UPI001F61D402